MKDTIINSWDRILEFIRTEFGITEVSYRTWISNLRCRDVVDGTAIIYSEGTEIGSNTNFIQTKYGIFIKNAIEEITGINVEVSIVDESVKKPEVKAVTKYNINNPDIELKLNPDYTFDNFVVSRSNSIGHAAALKVAEAPGEYYNPLYIYGDPGLGKTHLMHSIAHFILENSPSLKIMYVTSEVFMNELIESIRHGNVTPAAFREKYRNVDVLLIDDIQFIIGKDSTQEEFFHTFNYLYEAKKQIVISSDKPPKDFNNLEERLKSRFECGLTVDLTAPDYETKIAILKRKIEMKQNERGTNIDISDDALDYIAKNITTNIRSLEGALTKVIVKSNIMRIPADLDFTIEALRDVIDPSKKKIITPDFIINLVAEHYKLNVNEIFSDKRDKYISVPRQVAMYLSKKYTDCTSVELEKVFKRDHSTVLHGIKKIEDTIDKDIELSNNVNTLVKKMNVDN